MSTDGFREIIFHKTDDGNVKVEILLQDENLWLTQAKMAELFEVDRTVITKHIGNIVKERELRKKATCAKIALRHYVHGSTMRKEYLLQKVNSTLLLKHILELQ